LINLIEFTSLADQRGGLTAIEVFREIPFEVKRVYYLYKTQQDVTRGYHAHKKLKQVAVCLSGQCTFILDNGLQREKVTLSDPNKGLLIESFLWREMEDFSEDCVLLVLASEYYDESDYIRDYEVFLKIAGN
jgi:dTDP-4-dehydrorhamnose 3,5-epimerase-like enzyme